MVSRNARVLKNNPQFIVSGFKCSGISGALDHCQIKENSEPDVEQEPLSDKDVSENDTLELVSSDTDQ